MTREELIAYAKKHYHTKPEQPWQRYPENVVLRHADNRKWYGLIMNIDRDKLGLPDTRPVDVLNVKCDPMLADVLRETEGIFPGYHMNHREWITILLDGTVKKEQVLDLLDMSYSLTASKKNRAKTRGPVEWIIPANPKYYDVEKAFRKNRVINWKQSNNIRVGDIIYMYMAAPVSAILYKCRAVEVDIPYRYEDENLTIRKRMRIELLEEYESDRYTLERLKQYGVYAVRGPRSMPNSLSAEINAKYD